ncbi:unnamed protein product [Owenia fusiformis]|uniref:Uncharacterized protein n=1 Tax=Owenia fusiformis TaxID=6347 RepID=A0A8J1TGJ2_OWEFU|nr:unnamed protein product [Owenia fusiformis]
MVSEQAANESEQTSSKIEQLNNNRKNEQITDIIEPSTTEDGDILEHDEALQIYVKEPNIHVDGTHYSHAPGPAFNLTPDVIPIIHNMTIVVLMTMEENNITLQYEVNGHLMGTILNCLKTSNNTVHIKDLHCHVPCNNETHFLCYGMVKNADFVTTFMERCKLPGDFIKKKGEKYKSILLALMGMVTMISNGFVIFAIFTSKQRASIPGFPFVLVLALNDFLVGFSCLSRSIFLQYYIQYQQCLVFQLFCISPICGSLVCMKWIAIDRYIAIFSPLKYYKIMSRHNIAFAIAHIWLHAVSIGVAPLLGWNMGRFFQDRQYCTLMYIVGPGYLLFLFFLGLCFPMAIISVVYFKIFRRTRSHIKIIDAQESSVRRMSDDTTEDTYLSSMESLKQKEQKPVCIPKVSFRNMKAVKTLAIVIGCFLITWGPFTIATLITIMCKTGCHLRTIISSHLLMLGLSNSFLNCFIYAYGNRNFRRVLKDAFMLCICQKSNKIQHLDTIS